MERPRLLIIKLSSFGDIFHALPAVHNLKTALGADVDWLTQPEYAALVRCFPEVETVLTFPRQRPWAGLPAFVRGLRARRYDLVVDLQGLLKSAVAARLAHAGRRLGPSFQREGARWFYDAVVGPRDKDRHAVEECLDGVRYLGLPVAPVEFPVRFPAVANPWPGPRVAIVPVSRRWNKNWPESHFLALAASLRRELDAALYVMGGPAERPVCERLIAGLGALAGDRVMNLAGRTDLVQMGSWMGGMDVVVANDSGPIHMAAALGIPVVTMFGPTDPRRTGPYGSMHRVLTSDLPCRPCLSKDCRLGRPECLARIGPAAVCSAVQQILAART
jgi:lipopolysaccharide heptosyltransferase I